MCGIVGVVSTEMVSSSEILRMLKRLDYRGYDSWGFATNRGDLVKEVGQIPAEPPISISSHVGIAHTRWSTHGGVTKENAHPHTDCSGNLTVVHNGIIENYAEMKAKLEKIGHSFRSQTDTEVIAHFFEEKMKQGKPVEGAIEDFFKEAEGTFAILLVRNGENRIYALKRDSPLAIGIIEGGFIIASDIYAFSGKTEKAIWFDNNEWAVIEPTEYSIFDSEGKQIQKPVQTFTWPSEPASGKFEHFMIKEIHESPDVARRLLVSLKTSQKEKLTRLCELMRIAKKVVFVAAGTSYHATLLGVYFLNRAGIEAQTIIASEFSDYAFIDHRTLVIALSQSGETMDVIKALQSVKRKGAMIASLVNVPYSTIQRMSDISMEICAGQEVCVAATKSFVNQVMLLATIAKQFGYDGVDIDRLPTELEAVFESEENIKALAKQLKDAKDLYILGRGLAYPVSREIALKLKEISYIHAEGMMGGELKHGTLALIEPGIPVIGLVDNTDIISNLKEVESRGGNIIVFADCPTEFKGIHIKASSQPSFALGATILGQLLTYYTAKERGLPIDKPRNLAKSVTVK